MFDAIQLTQLNDENLFEAGDESGTFFHGPSVVILGCHFHTFAFAVETDEEGIQSAVSSSCEENFRGLQDIYPDDRYKTINIRGKECILIIHPFAD